MAFTPTNQLVHSPGSPVVLLRDQEHAARLFADDQFRLAPKWNFGFHVAFNINAACCKNTSLLQAFGQEINMLVKSIDLPKFSITVDQVNQYNRKKQIQTHHKFNDCVVKFHDDNMSLINQIWQQYYSYYYADSTSAQSTGSYNRNATRNSDFITKSYGLDNGSSVPFFNYIKVYQMARHEWICYTLVNPIIKDWNHNNVAYVGNTPHDFSMTLSYEAVKYDMGSVTDGTVEGFGVTHYDTTPSPLQGGGTGTGASPTFLNQQSTQASSQASLSNTVNTINSYQNTQQSTAPVSSTNIVTISAGPGGLSGLPNISFPIPASNTSTTVATQVVLPT
jgi:hypothetical protein